MFCKNCGSQIDDGSRFCTNCGCTVDNIQQAPSQYYNQNPVNSAGNQRVNVNPPHPVQYTPPVTPTGGVYYTQPKKESGVAFVIIGILAALIVVVAGVFLFFFFTRNKDNYNEADTSSSSSVTIASIEDIIEDNGQTQSGEESDTSLSTSVSVSEEKSEAYEDSKPAEEPTYPDCSEEAQKLFKALLNGKSETITMFSGSMDRIYIYPAYSNSGNGYANYCIAGGSLGSIFDSKCIDYNPGNCSWIFIGSDGYFYMFLQTEYHVFWVYRSGDSDYKNEYSYSFIDTFVIGDYQDSEGYVINYSDRVYLNERDLACMTKAECMYARNEIYARHGRKFNDEGLQNYFNSKCWYYGTIAPDKFSDDMLNEYELANALFIRDYEKEHFD